MPKISPARTSNDAPSTASDPRSATRHSEPSAVITWPWWSLVAPIVLLAIICAIDV